MITVLIDKLDTVEIVRDRIAQILTDESANQQALATADGQDPALWALRVFTERSSPWELLPPDTNDTTPVVNVWIDTSSFDLASGNVTDRQKNTARIMVDCIAQGITRGDGAGQITGDEDAARTLHRATRLVRNILMADIYTYLDLRGVVWRRWLATVEYLRPRPENENAQRVMGARMAFEVGCNEFSPQYEPVELELLAWELRRSETGEILATGEFDYTAATP